MTLQSYSPEMFDQLALRLLDLASAVREMAAYSRENRVRKVGVHDRKVLQWCQNLEQWGRRARAGLEVEVQEARAVRRVRQLG